MEWLADLGVPISDVYFSGDETVPRGHVTPGGAVIVEALFRAARRERNIDFAFARRVDRLLTSETGDGDVVAVTGVGSGDDEVTAGAVVLATGGIEGNRDLIDRLLPGAVLAGGGWLYPNGLEPVARYSRGDAIGLGNQVGAEIAGFDRWLCTLRPNFSHESDPYLPGWLVCINGEGKRFMDEMAPYSVTQPMVLDQPGPIRVLFDDKAKSEATPKSTRQFKKVVIPGMEWEDWIEPVIDQMVESGKVVRGDSIGDLARRIQVPPTNLTAAIEAYNLDVSLGEDRAYLKRAEFMKPVATPPFYAAEVRLCQLSVTAVGPRIDRDARVRHATGRAIPGLYAAGECAGGVLGPVYVGSGNALASALVFGRVAGRSAAAQAARRHGAGSAAAGSLGAEA